MPVGQSQGEAGESHPRRVLEKSFQKLVLTEQNSKQNITVGAWCSDLKITTCNVGTTVLFTKNLCTHSPGTAHTPASARPVPRVSKSRLPFVVLASLFSHLCLPSALMPWRFVKEAARKRRALDSSLPPVRRLRSLPWPASVPRLPFLPFLSVGFIRSVSHSQ